MDKDILNLGIEMYENAVGLSDMERDDDGFIILKPTAKRVDERKATLTTDISSLEAKLKKFKEERTRMDKIQKTEEYKESKKKLSKKKAKKQKTSLLEMVFNNADHENDEDTDEEDGTYRDKKGAPKKKETTLDTTYGKRFSPVVSMLHDTIVEFDNIAAEIEEELKNARNMSKSMYRSSQIGNLISAKNSKLSAVKELASVATTVSNLEYKKEKDRQSTEGSDTSKAISNLGAKYLRGGLDIFDDMPSKKKKDKKSSGKKSNKVDIDDDDDDEEDSSIKKQREDDQRVLAGEFAKTLTNHKNDIKLTPHERYIKMEGKYAFMVVADPLDPDNTWKFIAVDPKTGKEIKGFKDDYPGLLPKKKNCRMTFDLAKMKCTDRNSARSYKVIFKD